MASPAERANFLVAMGESLFADASPDAQRLRHGMLDLIGGGDIESALSAASAVGDDRLQKAARGYVQPETFTHGTSEQRMQWFKRGLDAGAINACDTFSGSAP